MLSPRRPPSRLLSLAVTASTLVACLTVAGTAAHATGAPCAVSTTVSGGSAVTRFTGAGTCSWTPPAGVTTVDALVVGAGGGGGGGKAGGYYAPGGGGGGGGGHVTVQHTVAVSGSVDVVIGEGGFGGAASRADFMDNNFGGVGGSSSFGSVIASGGDRASGPAYASQDRAGGDGGSSGRTIEGAATQTLGGLNDWDGAGGGAGAGAAGSVGTDIGSVGGYGGAGGIGYTSSITGASVVYGGGGGGGGVWNGTAGTGGTGGSGGGGNGGGRDGAATPGADGLGGGGGGGGYKDVSTSTAGARGGDGVVIVTYSTSAQVLVVTTAPGNTVAGGSLQAPIVQIQDGSGHDVALAGVTVTATVTTGTGTLSGATASTDASGYATFSGFALSGGEGDYVVTFTASTLTSATSPIQITPATPPSAPAPAPSVAPMPTPTPTPTPTASTPPVPAAMPFNEASAPPPGTSQMVIGGQPVTVQNQPLPRGDGLAVTAGPVSIAVRSSTPSGDTVPLAPDGSLTLARSGEVPVAASGLAPGSTVTQTLHSDPISLGTVAVDDAGVFASKVTIPSTVPLGNHTLTFEGTTKTGEPFVLNVGVTVATPAVALGTHPVLKVARGTGRSAGLLRVTASGVQSRCEVTFRSGTQVVRATASSSGQASAVLRISSTSNSRPTITATVSGKGCAARKVVARSS